MDAETQQLRALSNAGQGQTLEVGPDIIKDRRAALGLSSEEFADKAGFFPVFATIVEEHYLGLELWPIEVAKLVAEALEVSPEELILWIVNH